ncbi:hypothetical protein [Corallococcus sp. AB045]|uniref:hypothetical protein n=1 Tax=Corallococcus sp. AB045 TaxID=2316719 RepID=UPI0011C3B238|nr:hypothetical protein [Corallococcus sp. AB045]
MSERTPTQDKVRIGIEIEGIGTLKIDWNSGRRPSQMRALANSQPLTPNDLQNISTIQEHIKRQPLMRSGSFSENFPDGVRGLSIHAELSYTVKNLGKSHPAELVTTPHLLDPENLTYLKSSINEVIRGGTKGSLSGANSEQPFQMPELYFEQSHIPSQVITTKFTDETRGVLPHGIQTTVGIAADKLLSTDIKTRNSIVDFLIQPDSLQHKRFATIVNMACSASAFESELKLQDDQRYRFRLLLLMSLLHAYIPSFKESGGMAKDTYGANIKGYSSFKGCGINDMQAWSIVEGAGMLLSVLKGHEVSLVGQAVDKLGQHGLSAQVAYEGGAPIPCFLVGSRLHTVIEARQLAAPINQCIRKMLAAKPSVKPGGKIDLEASLAAQTIKVRLAHP